MSQADQIAHNNRVGPVLTGGPVARAVVEAAQIDNPGKEIIIDDKGAYVRVMCDDELILRERTIAGILGNDFEISELEVFLGSFAGRIESYDDYVRFVLSEHI